MGQYQQWLSAQEVERRLKVERETLETELLYLRDRIAILEQSVPEAENVILQALQEHLQPKPGAESFNREPPEWSGLPKLETPLAQGGEIASSLPAMDSQTERNEDMLAFFDRRGQTDASLSALLPGGGDEVHPVDAETRRLNENIQRWFIRWHRRITRTEQSEEARNE